MQVMQDSVSDEKGEVMSGEQLATTFKKSEEEAKSQWLRLLTDDGNMPVDVAFRSTYEIKKVLPLCGVPYPLGQVVGYEHLGARGRSTR